MTMGATPAARLALCCAVMPVLLAACLAHPPAPVSERSLVVGPTPAVYTVNKYDTLYSVAWRYELDVDRLAERNGIEPPYLIRRGQRILLKGTTPPDPSDVPPSAPVPGKPAPAQPGVESGKPIGDTKSPPAKPTAVPAAKPLGERPVVVTSTPKPPQSATPAPNAAPVKSPQTATPVKPPPTATPVKPPPAATPERPPQAAAPAKPASPTPRPPTSGSGGWGPPVDAKPSRGFGGGSKGYDYALPNGTLIRSASPGTVVYAGPAGPRIGPFRHLVIVEPRQGIMVAYGVNLQPSVKLGDNVRLGDMIARAGPGRSGGQFHFQVRERGTPVDPAKFIRG